MTIDETITIVNDLISTFTVLTLMSGLSAKLKQAIECIEQNPALPGGALDIIGMIAFEDAYAIHIAMEQLDSAAAAELQAEHEAMWHIQDACVAFKNFLNGVLPADPELRNDTLAAYHIMQAVSCLNPRIDLAQRTYAAMIDYQIHPALEYLGYQDLLDNARDPDNLILINTPCEICDCVNCICADEQDDVSDDTLQRYALNCFCVPGDDCHHYDN